MLSSTLSSPSLLFFPYPLFFWVQTPPHKSSQKRKREREKEERELRKVWGMWFQWPPVLLGCCCLFALLSTQPISATPQHSGLLHPPRSPKGISFKSTRVGLKAPTPPLPHPWFGRMAFRTVRSPLLKDHRISFLSVCLLFVVFVVIADHAWYPFSLIVEFFSFLVATSFKADELPTIQQAIFLLSSFCFRSFGFEVNFRLWAWLILGLMLPFWGILLLRTSWSSWFP